MNQLAATWAHGPGPPLAAGGSRRKEGGSQDLSNTIYSGDCPGEHAGDYPGEHAGDYPGEHAGDDPGEHAGDYPDRACWL